MKFAKFLRTPFFLIKFKFNFVLIKSIKFHKLVENYVISLLGLVPPSREITGKFTETIKKEKL